MVGKTRRCEICGVRESLRGGFFASFPKDEVRCKTWVKQVGKEDLVFVPIEKLYEERHVCGDHFEKRDFGKTGKRLKKRAYPKLHLSAPPLSDEQMIDFPQHVASKQVLAANPNIPAESLPMGLAPMQTTASTSRQPLATLMPQNQNVPSKSSSQPESLPTIRKSATDIDAGLAPTTTEEEMPAAPVASTSKKLRSTATTQNIIAHYMNVDESVVEPLASTSKTPLATSTAQHKISVPSTSSSQPETLPTKRKSTTDMEAVPSTSSSQPETLPTKRKSTTDMEAVPSTSSSQPETLPTKRKSTTDMEAVPSTSSSQPETLPTKRKSTTDMEAVPSTSSSQPETLPTKRKSTTDMEADASPKRRKLLQQLQSTKCKLASLKKSAKLIESVESSVLKELIESAIKNQKRKPQGKRYTTKQKISALAIYKRSPRTYRYLQHLVPLPSIKTLNNVLKKIPMQPGINQSVLQHLKNISANLERKNKMCVLCFDEMSLKPRLVYDIGSDKVEGFQDLGDSSNEKRTESLADHALVFLLQGLHQKFKQPLAYYFVKGTISSAKLSAIIKDVIKEVGKTGFDIIATICDQGPTNMGALKILKSGSATNDQEAGNFFQVESKKIWILYDVPHLFKSIRNNYLNCGEMHFNGKKAKWSHLVKVHEKNKALLFLSKVSDNHVAPSYRAKMKVKFAAQMLSTTVSAVLKLLAEAETDPQISSEIMDTALVVQEMDRLFDCTNGPSNHDDIKRGIRENVSIKTNHLQVWADFRKKLATMCFVKNGQVNKNVKCVNGYITTLSSLQDLWHHVHDFGFKYLNLRQLNQDALENLFGLIRQHSPTNKNPTATGFIGALKTSIISGMTAPHSRGSNCLKDDKTLLTDFHHLVFGQQCESNKENEGGMQETVVVEENIPVLHIEDDIDIDYNEITEELLSNVDKQACVYVSGYIASLLTKNNECQLCKDALVAESRESTVYAYIQLREWWPEKTSLTYPSLNLCKLIEQACDVFEKEIIPRLHEKNICQLCVTLFLMNCDAKWLICQQHSTALLNALYIRLGRLLIRRQCARINEKLSQKEEYLAASCKKAQQQGAAK